MRTREFAQRFQHAHHVIFTAVDQGADQADDLCAVVSHGHHADVQGGFNHAFRHVRVADHAVRGRVQQLNKAVTRLFSQCSFIRRDGFQHHGQVLLFRFQFVFQDIEINGSELFQRISFVCGNGHGSESFAWDCVTQRTAVEIYQTQIQLGSVASQETGQQLVGIA